MRMCRRLALLALLLALAGRGARSQEEVPAVRTEVVQVGVVVTDKDGRAVRDLTREDFVVLEDGKRQRITHFLVAGKRGASVPEGASAPRVPVPEGAGPAGAEPGRDIVVVVDDLHIDRANLDAAKEALQLFVNESVAADDNVAIVITSSRGGVQPLTQDRAVLRRAIDRLRPSEATAATARGMDMTPAQAELILRGDRAALQLATRLLMDEPGSVVDSTGPRATVEASSGGFTPAGIEPGEKAAVREAQRQAWVVLGEALSSSETTLSTVEDVLRALSSRPGRKVCLLVSDGFLVGMGTSAEQTRQMRRVVDAATRSGTAVYALDVRRPASARADAGVSGPAAPPGLRERVARLAEQEAGDTLLRLANDTGGFLVHGTTELAPGFRRILEDGEASHLIAYESANTKRDGRFRNIEVRLPRHPELTVRARRGYFAPGDRKQASSDRPAPSRLLTSVAAPPAIDEAEARAALDAPLPQNGMPVQMTADYLELPPAGPQVVVRAHLDLAGIRWREVGDRRQATVDLVCGVYDADGRPVGVPFGRRTELDLGPEEWKRAAEAGVQYQQQTPLPPGRYQVRLVAREPKLAPLGGAAQWVEIPELGEKKLAMSGVFLSSSPAPTSAASGAGGSATLRDSHTRRFKSSDSLYFQFYVYNPLVDEKGTSDVVVQAQIWSEGKVVAASKPKAAALDKKDGVIVPETNGMPLESLAPGSYELRVVVVDRRVNATSFRNVDFTVERADN